MKIFELEKFFVYLILSSLSVFVQGQNLDCSGENSSYYLNEVYADYSFKGVKYAIKPDFEGVEDELFINVYQPEGQNQNADIKRPVVLLPFGGGFRTVSRKSPIITYFAEYYVKRGYVVCVPSYRIGWPNAHDGICGNGTEADYIDAMYRAAQDLNSAIDFIKSKSEQWSIDKENVFVHGISAGAIAALIRNYNHAELLDQQRVERLGPLSTPEMDVEIKSLVSFAGAMLADFDLREDAVPLLLIHGSCDGAVPYASGRLIDCKQFPVYEGSLPIYERALDEGKPCGLHTFCGYVHELELSVGNTVELERSFKYILDQSVEFFHSQLCDQELVSNQYVANSYIDVNPIASCQNFEAYESCLLDSQDGGNQIDIVPSHIKFRDGIFINSLQLEERKVIFKMYDSMGNQICNDEVLLLPGYTKIAVLTNALNGGLYFVNIFNEEKSERLLCKKIFVEGSLLQY